MSRKKKIGLVLLTCFSVIGSVICLELALRFHHTLTNKNQFKILRISAFKSEAEQKKLTDFYSSSYHQLVPYFMWRTTPQLDGEVVKTNTLGYRDGEWKVEKTEGTVRVVVLGGSAAWGYGASTNETTISSYLEKKLSAALSTQKVEVLNAANNGYTSTQEILRAIQIMKYQPDLVIIYNGYNEVAKDIFGWDPTHQFIFFDSSTFDDDNLFLSFTKIAAVRFDQFLEKSYLYRAIKYRVLGKPELKISTQPLETAQNYVENMKVLKSILDAKKIPAVFVLQPIVYVGEKKLSSEEELFLAEAKTFSEEAVKYFQDSYKHIKELAKNQREELILLDATDVFDDYENNIYIDNVHYSDYGNEVVSEYLGRYVIQQYLKLQR
jgi:lysophospholipase L1-like esterase